MGLARVQRLEWASAEDLEACEPPYDVVIAGDCLYEEACIAPLLETMWALAGPETEVRTSEHDVQFSSMCANGSPFAPSFATKPFYRGRRPAWFQCPSTVSEEA